MSSGAQNMKTGPEAYYIAENESGSAKRENGTRRPRYRRKLVRERKTRKLDPTPSVSPKMSPGAQNMKMAPDALGTPKMSPGAQNRKTGPDAIETAENESERAKQEHGTRRPQYRRKRFRERKT
jgi:hypothetical protein